MWSFSEIERGDVWYLDYFVGRVFFLFFSFFSLVCLPVKFAVICGTGFSGMGPTASRPPLSGVSAGMYRRKQLGLYLFRVGFRLCRLGFQYAIALVSQLQRRVVLNNTTLLISKKKKTRKLASTYCGGLRHSLRCCMRASPRRLDGLKMHLVKKKTEKIGLYLFVEAGMSCRGDSVQQRVQAVMDTLFPNCLQPRDKFVTKIMITLAVIFQPKSRFAL